jgi:hypothetical protein
MTEKYNIPLSVQVRRSRGKFKNNGKITGILTFSASVRMCRNDFN